MLSYGRIGRLCAALHAEIAMVLVENLANALIVVNQFQRLHPL